MNHLNNSSQNVLNKSIHSNTPAFDVTKVNEAPISQEATSQSESNFIPQEAFDSNSEILQRKRQEKQKRDQLLKVFGGICMALFVAAWIVSPSTSIDTSAAAKDALTNKSSSSLSAGTILLAKDEFIGAQDYTIIHESDKSDTKIWVWDYAAEDGDYVQVLVNGTPIGAAFMIKHKPVEFMVPAIGEVQIKGIRDGGGGITYAVKYDLTGTTYFNSAPEGNFNTYTLIKR